MSDHRPQMTVHGRRSTVSSIGCLWRVPAPHTPTLGRAIRYKSSPSSQADTHAIGVRALHFYRSRGFVFNYSRFFLESLFTNKFAPKIRTALRLTLLSTRYQDLMAFLQQLKDGTQVIRLLSGVL